MRLFLSTRIPDFERAVLVESGSRQLLENLLPVLYARYGDRLRLDVVTCYHGSPAGFRPEQGRIWPIAGYAGAAGARRLVRELRAEGFPITGILCSDEPIMFRWKWLLAAGLPGKLFIVNENGDYFWFDRSNWSLILHFLLFRLGLAGAGAVVTIGRIVLFPLSLLYLLAYAGIVHTRRKVRA